MSKSPLISSALLFAIAASFPTSAWAEPASEASSEASTEPDSTIDERLPLVVEVSGLNEMAVLEALELRLPGRLVLGYKQQRPEGTIVYALVRRQDDGLLHLTLIEPTGNAYDRILTDEPGQSVRAAAAALANLLHSVETGAAIPSRTAVSIPEDPPEETPPAELEPTETVPEPPAPAEPPPEPNLWIGASLRPGASLGLLPRTNAGVFAGAGGAVAVAVRGARGGTASASFRALGRSAYDVSLVRLRVGLSGGWTWRPGAAEIAVLAGPFVEPWLLRREGDRAPLLANGRRQSSLPLLGALVHVGAGYLVRPASRRDLAVRIGAFAEAAGSFVPDAGGRTIAIAIEHEDGTVDPGMRLGGLEIEFGLEVTVWFGVRTRTQTK